LHFRIKDELIPLNLVVVGLVIAVYFFPDNVTRVVLALPCLLFFPGYTLIAALFPRRGMGTLVRLVLSLGMSAVVVPLIGLILNYTAWGIRLEPVLFSLMAFIVVMSGVTYARRHRLPAEERFGVSFRWRLPGGGGTRWDRGLTIGLAVAVMAALGVLTFTVTYPKVGETFTEFYILGSQGQLAGYPATLTVGETGQVTVGVINREQTAAAYRVEVTLPGTVPLIIGTFTLQNNEIWQQLAAFTPRQAGTAERVEFQLYKEGESGVYREVHIWIDVSPSK
jgi:uncharacterized membrane protein